jgi:outer membrane protein assembly factor BamB
MMRLAACLVCFLPLTLAGAADWPQWRGPMRDGVSSEPVEPWKGELKVLWRQPVGEGHSSPVVAAGTVYLHVRVRDKEQEEVLAFDAATGKEQWRSTYDRGEFKNIYGNGPRSTPVVDAGRLYTLGVTGILTCWDAAKGTQQWRTNLLQEFKAPNLFFGVSTSPVVEKEKLLVLVGGPEASIVALDKSSGRVLWTSGTDKASYASPIVVSQAGQRLAIFFTHAGVSALNPEDGQRYWHFPLVDKLSESSTTPVLVENVLFAGSVTAGSVGLKLTAKEGQPGYEQAWKNEQLTCYFSTPVAVGEHLYLVTGSLVPPAAHLHCVEARSGKVQWTRRNVGKYHATVLRAQDRLLILEEEGNLALFEPNAKEYKELARAKICGSTWAHPALSNGRLFVRDGAELICVQLAEKP